MDNPIAIFKSGVQNLLNNEVIPADAAQDAVGFVTQDGRTKLIGGRILVGADSGVVGKIRGLHFGYKVNGTLVLYRKTETTIDYFDNPSQTWVSLLTGLTTATEASFANYTSLSGAFTFVVTQDGYWKINNANPASPISMYDPLRNYIGTILIDRGRTILWNKSAKDVVGSSDPTGLYGSWIDPQNGGGVDNPVVYASITGEAVGSSGSTAYSGTLLKTTAQEVTITHAAPGVFGLVAHGFTANTALVFSSNVSLPAPLIAGKTYYVVGDGTLGADSFTVSASTPSSGTLTGITTTSDGVGIHTIVATHRNVFALSFSATVAAGVETFTDDFLGNLTSNFGGTGTINYATGAYSLTFSDVTTGNVAVSYEWEDSNQGGITDFTLVSVANTGTQTGTPTRLSASGFTERQDLGGDKIEIVVVGQDGNYYSMKQASAYQLTISADDKTFTNQIYYDQMGIPSPNACIATAKGILFLNTSNPDKPEMTLLTKNLVTSTLLPSIVFPAFKFSNYDYSDCYFDTYERFVTVSCKIQGAAENNRILLCNISDGAIDIEPYEARMFAKDKTGALYCGSSIQPNVYNIFSGFDDLGNPINAYWMGAGQQYGNLKSRTARWRFIREELKKFRKFNIKGMMSLDQSVEVFISYDDAPFQQIGTIYGRASYVQAGAGQEIGSNFIGNVQIGGAQLTNVYPYFAQIKLKNMPKFRKRTIKLVPTGIGYFDFDFQSDFDIMLFENRLPSQFRSKQSVSLDGKQTDLPVIVIIEDDEGGFDAQGFDSGGFGQ